MSTISPTPEPALTAAHTVIPLAEYLAVPLAPYLGVLTPKHLDAPDAETRALLHGAALHDLGWLRRITVRGEDRFRWLSGMVTNAVDSLPDNSGAYNLILNAQGRIQGDGCVWRESDALEIELTLNQAEALLAHLDHFIVMDDVELVPLTGQSAIGLTGPLAAEVLAALSIEAPPEVLTSSRDVISGIPVRLTRNYGTVVPHFAIWAESGQIPTLWQAIQEAGASPVGTATLETLRIIEGIAAYGTDIQIRDLPQETSLTRALSFTKGCYLGQEIVERIRARGQVHRHLRHLELSPEGASSVPEPGTELHKPDSPPDAKPAGELTSVTAITLEGIRRVFALAMIRAEAAIGTQPLMYPGGTAQILKAPPSFN